MHTPTRSADQPVLRPFTRWELGHLVDSWAQSGRTLPVAVVVSIFDDLCEALAGAPPGDDVVVSLEHVVIDQAGVARMTVRPREVVPAVSALLREALAAGRGDEAIPAAAWPVLGQGLAEDPWVRPAGTDVIQHQLREALGPPAARDEVVDCCAALVSGAPRTSVSAPAPMPERTTTEARSRELVSAPQSAPPVRAPSVARGPASATASAPAVEPAAPSVPWEVPSIVPMEVELGSIAPARAQLAARDPHDANTDVATPLEVPSVVGPASELPAVSSWRPRWGEDAPPAPLLTRDRAASAPPPAAAPASTSSSAIPAAAASAVAIPAPRAASASGAPVLASVSDAPVPTTSASGAPVPASVSEVRVSAGAAAAAERLLAPAPLATPPRPAGAPVPHLSGAPAVSSTPPGTYATVSAVLPEDLDEPPSLLPKPVVRHDPPRRRAVSLPAAPAARLGSTASTPLEDRSSSIELPSESPLQRILIGTLALACAALVAWLLGLV